MGYNCGELWLGDGYLLVGVHTMYTILLWIHYMQPGRGGRFPNDDRGICRWGISLGNIHYIPINASLIIVAYYPPRLIE